MNNRPRTNGLAAALTLIITAASANAAVFIPGTSIGIDFGATAPTNNFNQINAATGGSFGGSFINTSGVTVDAVGFSWSRNGTNTFISGTSNALVGQPGVFNASNLEDTMGFAQNGDPTSVVTLTFTGLNDSLTYDLIVGAGFSPVNNNGNVLWAASGESATTDSDVGENSFVTLTGLSTDGSGNLVITGTGTGSRSDIVFVSALHLTAVPEPSAALLGGIGLLALLRRRR